MTEPRQQDGKPSFADTILAMDVVDTLRHDERMKDFELGDADRRNALRERLKQTYEAQGTPVDDAILDRAIEKMNEDRYVHKRMASGPGRWLATAYVRRCLFASAAGIAALVVVAAVGTFRYIGHAEEQRQIAAAADLEHQIEVVLPGKVNTSSEWAESYAAKMGDSDARARVTRLREEALNALKIRDAKVAEAKLAEIDALADDLQASLRAEADRKEADARAEKQRQSAKALVAEADAQIASIDGSVRADSRAMSALRASEADVRDAAGTGDRAVYERKLRDLDGLAGYIRLPYEIRIVDRNGAKAGFEWTDDQNGGKLWFIVVEAVSPTGKVAAVDVTDFHTQRLQHVSTWAVRVTNAVYQRLKRDKKDDGVINDNIAGNKPAGSLDVDWKVDTVGGQLLNSF